MVFLPINFSIFYFQDFKHFLDYFNICMPFLGLLKNYFTSIFFFTGLLGSENCYFLQFFYFSKYLDQNQVILLSSQLFSLIRPSFFSPLLFSSILLWLWTEKLVRAHCPSLIEASITTSVFEKRKGLIARLNSEARLKLVSLIQGSG